MGFVPRIQVVERMSGKLLLIVAFGLVVQSCGEDTAARDEDVIRLQELADAIGMISLWKYDAGEIPLEPNTIVDLYEEPQSLGVSACQTRLFSIRVDASSGHPGFVAEEGIATVKQVALRPCTEVQLDDFNPVYGALTAETAVESMAYLSDVLECKTESCFRRLDATFDPESLVSSLPDARATFNWEARRVGEDSILIILMHAVARGELLAVDLTRPKSDGAQVISGRFFVEPLNVDRKPSAVN